MNYPPADPSAQQRTGRAIGERPGVARQNFTSQFVVEAPGQLLQTLFASGLESRLHLALNVEWLALTYDMLCRGTAHR